MIEIKYNKHAFVLLIPLFIPCLLIAQVLSISNNMRLIANGNISLVADQSGIKNDGIFIAGNSTVYFSGASTTAISGSQPLIFYNLVFRGTGTKLNAGNTSVIGTLGVEGTTVLDADGTLNDQSFTLRSSDTATARVDKLINGNIIGNVTVERFINTGTAVGQHLKSWQFLATPTTGQTYNQSWQEAGATPAGYGTWITGTGTGFDATTALPSLKLYDASTSNWVGITNTGDPLQNKLGYMLFVRGDRTVTAYNAPPDNTNMRSKGVLFTPFNPPPAVPVAANKFQSFGNPYASRVEFNKVYQASTGINDVFYVWDPKLGGTSNAGGYQTISGITGYLPTAGGTTASYAANIPAPFIESGQAAFVHGNITGGYVNFNESCKAAGSCLITKAVAGGNSFIPNRGFMQCSLFTNTGMIADGNIVAFETGLGNNINQYDAIKLVNTVENFAIKRDEKLLAVEARDNISINDTIFYSIQNLRQQPYQFRFVPTNIFTSLTAYLIDRYNNSSTMISLTDSSFIDFTINADTGSYAANRFILVFQQPVIVPLFFVNIAAVRNTDQTNQIIWRVDNETGIQQYMIERSADGTTFNTINHVFPQANNGAIMSYSNRDNMPLPSINFYRINAVSSNGEQHYSHIVKVESPNDIAGIKIFPNPVLDKTIAINFRNQKQGNYAIQLTNKAGQVIYKNIVHVDQANFVYSTRPGNILSSGTYQLCVIKEDGNKWIEQIIVR